MRRGDGHLFGARPRMNEVKWMQKISDLIRSPAQRSAARSIRFGGAGHHHTKYGTCHHPRQPRHERQDFFAECLRAGRILVRFLASSASYLTSLWAAQCFLVKLDSFVVGW